MSAAARPTRGSKDPRSPQDVAKKAAKAFAFVLSAGFSAAKQIAAAAKSAQQSSHEVKAPVKSGAGNRPAAPTDDAEDYEFMEPPNFVPIMFLDPQKAPAGFQAALYERDQLTANVGDWRSLTSAKLCYDIFSFCDLSDVVKCQRVCKSWKCFLGPLLRDHRYLKHCARSGFVDAKRGGSWRVLAGARTPDALKRAEFWELAEQHSDRREEIERDIARTLIHYDAFATEEEAIQALNGVLQAYSVHDSDVGYTQGLNFVAAFLLMRLPIEDAYWLLYTLMVSPRFHLRVLYLHGLPGLKVCQFQFQQLFQLHHPRLAAHFEKHGVVADLYTTEWFMTLFTYRAIPPETSARIWDTFLADGWKAIHRAGLAILSISEHTLLQYEFEGIVQYLKFFPDQGIFDAELLVNTACYFKVTNRMLQKLSDRFRGQSPAR